MKISMGCDHGGFGLKETIKAYLTEQGHEVKDFGCYNTDSCDYPELGAAAAKAVAGGECERGIVICGTGGGVSLIVNKMKGVYCVACESIYTAERTALVNNANVLAMGGNVVSHVMGCEMAEKWLAGNWCEGFNEERKARNVKGFEVLTQVEQEG